MRIITLTLALHLSGAIALGQGAPTYNMVRYGSTISELEQVRGQIADWSKVVGAVRSQISTLQQVTSAIHDLENVVHDGVRGITSTVLESVGVTDLLKVMYEVQLTYTDGQNLAKDVAALPDEAKYYLKNIGLEANNLRDFLRSGLVYDTMHKLSIEQWKNIAENPWKALEDGSFGLAIYETSDYLDPNSRTRAWREFMASQPASQSSPLNTFRGTEYIQYLGANWLSQTQGRVEKVADLRAMVNKMAEKYAEPDGKLSTSIQLDLNTATAVSTASVKINAQKTIDQEMAQSVVASLEAEKNAITSQIDQRDQNANQAEVSTASP